MLREFAASLHRSPAEGGRTNVIMPDWAMVFGTGGLVKERGTVDGHPFRSSFVALGDGQHKLPVRADLRRVLDKDVGDSVRVTVHERRDGRSPA